MAERDEFVVWSQDMFDRATPPRQERRGQGLAAGLAALWDKHLSEGVQDDGRSTLTAFHLVWRDEHISIPEQRPGAHKLRQWAKATAGLAGELAAIHAAAGDRSRAAAELLELAAAAVTADEFRARARSAAQVAGGNPAAPGAAEKLLRAAATRQQRLQWLGVGAWAVLAIMLAAAVPAVPAHLAQLQKALYGGIVLFILIAVGTLAETLVLRRRGNAVLSAITQPGLLAAAEYTVGRFKAREIHRVTLTLTDGTRAKFVLSAEGAATVMRELEIRCPQAVAAGRQQ